MVDSTQLAGWLSRLVQTPSVSPAQVGPKAGVPGEARMTETVAEALRGFGGRVTVEEVLPGRSNVYATFLGSSGQWAAVDVHMDTVGVEQMTVDPFDGRIADRKVHGRGAVDTKATLGVVLALLEDMHARRAKPVPNLLVAATVDEEVGMAGAPACAAWIRRQDFAVDQLAVAEPTMCGPVTAHKGALRLEFAVSGVPAHSSQPERGKNAILAAMELVGALEEENRRLSRLPADSRIGHPTLTTTLIQGGTGLNVVPDHCSVSIDRRLVPGENLDDVAAQLIQLAQMRCPLPVEARPLKRIPPFVQPEDSPWVRRLAEWSGRPPGAVPYGTNAWAYVGLAKECVVIGPGSIDQAHGTEEWVEIAELERLAGIYSRWWGLSEG